MAVLKFFGQKEIQEVVISPVLLAAAVFIAGRECLIIKVQDISIGLSDDVCGE